eukprot:5172724-Prymnesium_polylepis.1
MGARAGADRVGAGPGSVLSVLFAREGARGSGHRVPWRDGSVAFAPEALSSRAFAPFYGSFTVQSLRLYRPTAVPQSKKRGDSQGVAQAAARRHHPARDGVAAAAAAAEGR